MPFLGLGLGERASPWCHSLQHFTVDIIIPILWMKKLRLREDEKLGQIYTGSKWQRRDLTGLSRCKV